MKRITQLLHRLEDSVLILLLLAMILLAGIDILARSLFGGGTTWIPPLLRVMVLWLGLLGALMATRSREHIAIDLINRLAGPLAQRILGAVTAVFAAVVCGIIAWHSKEFVLGSLEYGDTAFGDIPAWPLQTVIPASFGLMSLRFIVQALENAIYGVPQSDSPTDNEENNQEASA